MELRRVTLAFLVCSLALGLNGCDLVIGPRLKQANVDQVTNGMAKKQVESILGPPTTVSEIKGLDMTLKTTYVYQQGEDSVTIVFFDDKLESKLSTLKK